MLRAAAALLARNPGATMDEVARAVGVGRATLHRHFAGRDALVRALEEQGIAEFGAAMDAARLDEGSSEEALRRLVAALEPGAQLYGFLVNEAQLFQEDVNEGWDRLDARIAAFFRRGQERGEFRIDLPAAWLTEALYGLLVAAVFAVQQGRVAANDFTYLMAELMLGGARRSVTR